MSENILRQRKPLLSESMPLSTTKTTAISTQSTLPNTVSLTQSTQNNTVEQISFRFPSDKTLKTASKMSIENDKPIMFDYWTLSLDKSVHIGIRANKEKYLIKSKEEYTSMIVKLYNIDNQDIICETENSIYIVANGIKLVNIKE